MISIKREATCSILSLFGIKIRLTTWASKYEAQGPYGLCDLICERAGIPYCVRGIGLQHGWTTRVLQSDRDKAKWLMLCWSKRYKENWEKVSDTPCKVAGAPFVHYRRMRGIEIAPTARGTIAFPAHNIKEIKQHLDLDEYCDQLKALPAPYQPVTVCLHPLDIQHYQLDKEYERRGLKTVCAAQEVEGPFYKGFYHLLSQHRFATSNASGTHLFYAVEMELPFFILGQCPKVDDDALAFLDQISVTSDWAPVERTYKLFATPPRGTISDEQREFVLSELGMNDCLSPEELASELRQAAVKEYYIPEPGKRRLSLFKKFLRSPRHFLQTLRFHKFVMESAKQLGHSPDMGNSPGKTSRS